MRPAETTLYNWPVASLNVPIGPRGLWAGETFLDGWWPPPRLVRVEVVDGMKLDISAERPVSNGGPGG